MERTKKHRYNFVGSIFKNTGSATYRQWVISFAERQFSSEDYLRITGPLVNATHYYLHPEIRKSIVGMNEIKFSGPYSQYEPMGKFDKSLDGYNATYPFSAYLGRRPHFPKFDELYWKAMVQSNFTLCPHGDNPFSIRFWEAMLAGSIPILLKSEHGHPEVSSRFGGYNISWKFYALELPREFIQNKNDIGLIAKSKQFEYRQDWVDANFNNAQRYMTFIEGDNKPPLWNITPKRVTRPPK